MSDWRSRMHPKVAKAELLIFMQLSKEGLTEGMVTQKTIILRRPDGGKVETIPDFTWQLMRKVLYLDGDRIHVKKRIDRDGEIMELLESNNWKGKRIRYHAPLKVGSPEFFKIMECIRKFRGETEPTRRCITCGKPALPDSPNCLECNEFAKRHLTNP